VTVSYCPVSTSACYVTFNLLLVMAGLRVCSDGGAINDSVRGVRAAVVIREGHAVSVRESAIVQWVMREARATCKYTLPINWSMRNKLHATIGPKRQPYSRRPG
jgi:hypothetical protein